MNQDLEIIPAPSWSGRIDRRGGASACWVWTGSCMTNGYGQTRVKESGRWRSAGAHQVAYYLATGRWERKADRRLVRHLCHNRRCCNPAHLTGGTASDNADDRKARAQGIALLPRQTFILPVAGIANSMFAGRAVPVTPMKPFHLPVAGLARDWHPAVRASVSPAERAST